MGSGAGLDAAGVCPAEPLAGCLRFLLEEEDADATAFAFELLISTRTATGAGESSRSASMVVLLRGAGSEHRADPPGAGRYVSREQNASRRATHSMHEFSVGFMRGIFSGVQLIIVAYIMA
jgi:hypothetical protein